MSCAKRFANRIKTLQFNSSNILPDNPFLKSRTIRDRNIFQDIQSKVNSVTDAVATSLPDAITGLPGAIADPIQDMEEYIPKNCSLGTAEFCVGYKHKITCKKLPLSLSDLVPDIAQHLPDGVQVLPDILEKPLQDLVQEFQKKLQEKLQPLERTLKKVTTPFVQKCLVAGLVLFVIIAILFACAIISGLFNISSVLLRLTIGLRVVVVLGLVCCILLFIPTIVLGLFQAKAKALPSWVEVEKGQVGGLCVGALCCAVVMTFLATITPIII